MRLVFQVFVASLFAQSQPPPLEDRPVFRAETSLAMVRFHVLKDGMYSDQLTPKDIQLLEDGEPRQITYFEGGRTGKQRSFPVEITLLFDISGSVWKEGLLDPVVYSATILEGIPTVKLAVYGFDSNLMRFCRPTRDTALLADTFHRIQAYRPGSKPRPEFIRLKTPPKRRSSFSGTWIYESALAAAKEAAKTPGEASRMILMFSDGLSTTYARPEDVAGEIRDLGVTVYATALGHKRNVDQISQLRRTGIDSKGQLTSDARRRLSELENVELQIGEYASLGELTGGRSFDPTTLNFESMRTILRGLAGAIFFEYVAGFRPDTGKDKPRKHQLQVKLVKEGLGKLTGGTRAIVY